MKWPRRWYLQAQGRPLGGGPRGLGGEWSALATLVRMECVVQAPDTLSVERRGQQQAHEVQGPLLVCLPPA